MIAGDRRRWAVKAALAVGSNASFTPFRPAAPRPPAGDGQGEATSSEATSKERVHPPQAGKARHVRVGRMDLGLMLDRQSGQVCVRGQIAAGSGRLDELEA